MKQNDYIRIGRQIIRIARIFTENLDKSNPPGGNQPTSCKYISYGEHIEKDANEENLLSDQNIKNANSPQCRICLEYETSTMKFMSDVCKCKSMPVHFNCLKNWMTTKVQTTNFKNMIYYDITQLACEVCKERLPPIVQVDNKDMFLVNITLKETKDVIILEVFELLRERIKGILVIDFNLSDKTEILLGRSEDADVMFKDVSISRNHAKFVWKNGNFYIFNIDSKFGTVKRESSKIGFHDLINKKFVVDKFVLAFHVGKNKKICKCAKKQGYRFFENPIDNNRQLFKFEVKIPQEINPIKGLTAIDSTKEEKKLVKQEMGQSQVTKSNISQQKTGSSALFTPQNQPSNFPTTGESEKIQSLRIIDPVETETVLEQEKKEKNSKNLIDEEFEQEKIDKKFGRQPNSNNIGLTSSRRLLDVLNENEPKTNAKMKEILEEEEEKFESNFKKSNVKNNETYEEYGKDGHELLETESSKTISYLYLRSYKNYNFN